MSTEPARLRTIVNQDGAAILNIAAGMITTLNFTGAFVWEGLQRGEDVDMIAQNLARETGEETDAIKKDLLEFIDAMKKEKLLAY
jgi:hypothetical protein